MDGRKKNKEREKERKSGARSCARDKVTFPVPHAQQKKQKKNKKKREREREREERESGGPYDSFSSVDSTWNGSKKGLHVDLCSHYCYPPTTQLHMSTPTVSGFTTDRRCHSASSNLLPMLLPTLDSTSFQYYGRPPEAKTSLHPPRRLKFQQGKAKSIVSEAYPAANPPPTWDVLGPPARRTLVPIRRSRQSSPKCECGPVDMLWAAERDWGAWASHLSGRVA